MLVFKGKCEQVQNMPPMMEASVVCWGGPIRLAFLRRAGSVSKRSIVWRASLICSWYTEIGGGRGGRERKRDQAVDEVYKDVKAVIKGGGRWMERWGRGECCDGSL
jgi:hypothetical protein